MRLLKDRRAVTNVVFGVIVLAVAIAVGAIVVAHVFTALPTTGLSAEANSTISSVQSMTWSAFGLLPIAIIVMAASAIISVVLVLRGR